MDVIYKVGVTIGIIAVYSVVTWGLGLLITLDGPDETATPAVAWLAGAVLFLILAIFTLEKFGLWMA